MIYLTFGLSFCLSFFNKFHMLFTCSRQMLIVGRSWHQHQHQLSRHIQKCVSTYNHTRFPSKKLQRFVDKEAIIRATARHPIAYAHVSPAPSPSIPRPSFRCAAVQRVAYTIFHFCYVRTVCRHPPSASNYIYINAPSAYPHVHK